MLDREIVLNAPQVIARELAIDPVEAQDLCDELGWFFRAVASESTMLTPSRAIDRAWHALMSDPNTYAEFCIAACGFQVRHLPGQSTVEDYRHTLAVMSKLRGGELSIYWPRPPTQDQAASCHTGGAPAPLEPEPPPVKMIRRTTRLADDSGSL